MKSLSVIELSKLYNINRQTIYNHINRGILSKNSDNKIDLSEAIRVFGEPIKKGNVKEDVKIDKIESAEVLLLRQQVDMLKNQLDDAKGRESFYQNQIETMQRLLEAPKDKVTSFTEQKNNQDIAVESNFKESIQEEELSNLENKKRSFFSSFFSKNNRFISY